MDDETIKQRQARRERISSLLGEKMLQGWCMLGSTCPKCGTIEMRDREKNVVCIACEIIDAEQPQSAAAAASTNSTAAPRAEEAAAAVPAMEAAAPPAPVAQAAPTAQTAPASQLNGHGIFSMRSNSTSPQPMPETPNARPFSLSSKRPHGLLDSPTTRNAAAMDSSFFRRLHQVESINLQVEYSVRLAIHSMNTKMQQASTMLDNATSAAESLELIHMIRDTATVIRELFAFHGSIVQGIPDLQ
ncbi:uncharacterized protein MONBRDRAFT_30894 [Monosiga brevicollis MX1]|uniref:Sjoegren syndrome/scleroderma autoantigen 1 n=1 Tax=Monosiga brevicollis TaxID=81824 RepID=A9UQ06_MONBE|nr:uncharacterized protein MONBRDRAFT_30894 [Monosiga brevicollis MX1]EDQ92512.1 predicted protein [Monosiga brevicollis MX1]|eukprot:XP_001742274.1 hypothetical protein [Monosiga brevicollis MX1]